jgi:acetyl esterase/lipase
VVVAIGGCYYEYEGQAVLPFIDLMVEKNATAKLDGDLVLVVGEDDDMCHAWQSEEATAALQAAGYDAELHVMPGGDHRNVVFWEQVNGEWVTVPNDPVGKEVVQIILDAIQTAMP